MNKLARKKGKHFCDRWNVAIRVERFQSFENGCELVRVQVLTQSGNSFVVLVLRPQQVKFRERTIVYELLQRRIHPKVLRKFNCCCTRISVSRRKSKRNIIYVKVIQFLLKIVPWSLINFIQRWLDWENCKRKRKGKKIRIEYRSLSTSTLWNSVCFKEFSSIWNLFQRTGSLTSHQNNSSSRAYFKRISLATWVWALILHLMKKNHFLTWRMSNVVRSTKIRIFHCGNVS